MGTEIEQLKQQLAASQAREVQLREALNTAADKFHDYAEYHSMKDQTQGNIEKVERNLSLAKMCDEALALPQDTTLLEAMIAESGEVMREMCADWCDRLTMYGPVTEAQQRYNQAYRHCKDRIRTIHGVTLEDVQK